jgi:hypothetical protein
MARLFSYQTFAPGPREGKPLRSDETPPTAKTFKSNDGALECAANLIRREEERQRKDPYLKLGPSLDGLEIECDDGTLWDYAEVRRRVKLLPRD